MRPAAGDVLAAWQAADGRMYADKHRSPDVMKRRSGGSSAPASVRSWPALKHAIEAPGMLDRLLRASREHLGMDVAIIGEILGDRYVFRHLSAEGESPYVAGEVVDAEATYCKRVLAGRLPGLINDIRDYPEAAAPEAQHHRDVRSYLGVPLAYSDGHVLGALCSVSAEPNETLDERDADFLRVMARVASGILQRERGTSRDRHALVQRLDRALAPRGLTAVFQPIVALAGGEVVGFEALSRFPADPSRSPERWFEDAGGRRREHR